LASVPLRALRRTEIDSRPSKLSWYGGTGLVVLWLDFDGGDSNQEIRLPDVIRSGREQFVARQTMSSRLFRTARCHTCTSAHRHCCWVRWCLFLNTSCVRSLAIRPIRERHRSASYLPAVQCQYPGHRGGVAHVLLSVPYNESIGSERHGNLKVVTVEL